MNKIQLIIRPIEKDLGDNFVVRRSLPDKRKRMVGPFVFWDHMGPAFVSPKAGMKVRAHPHIGLATITWLFSGEIMHRDSLGNEQSIRPGEVNWMTAGSGIVHSERSEPLDHSFELEGIQLWLALPKEFEDVDPSFYHCKEEDVPLIAQDGVSLRLIAGEALGMKSPVPVYSNLFYFNGEGQTGSTFQLDASANQEIAIYVIRGSVRLEDQVFKRFDLIILVEGEGLELKFEEDSHIMVFGGETFPEERHMWWNFVSTSQDKIKQAKQKWLEGKFPKVINEKETISLPGT